MARIRSVHPDLCTDEVLATLDGDTERCFVRLWTHLDDDGRCVDNPLLIKAALFPLVEAITSQDVDRWLHALAEAGLVRRYEVDGRRYLTAKPEAWGRWQKPRRKVDSKLPPEPPCADIVGTRADNGAQCPTGGGGVEGVGEEMETKKERESEGETEHAPETDAPVDNPIARGLQDRCATVPQRVSRRPSLYSVKGQGTAETPAEPVRSAALTSGAHS